MDHSDPVLPETEVTIARRAVLARYRQLVDQYLVIQSAKSALDQRAEQLLSGANDCFAAARVLQFDAVAFTPIWEAAVEAHQKQTAFLAHEALIDALARGPEEPKTSGPPPSSDGGTPQMPGAAHAGLTAPTIKDRVLVAAEKAYPNPVRVTELRQQFGQSGIVVHEKSLGVALYRWSKAGRVRREGRDWYYVPVNGSASMGPIPQIDLDGGLFN